MASPCLLLEKYSHFKNVSRDLGYPLPQSAGVGMCTAFLAATCGLSSQRRLAVSTVPRRPCLHQALNTRNPILTSQHLRACSWQLSTFDSIARICFKPWFASLLLRTRWSQMPFSIPQPCTHRQVPITLGINLAQKPYIVWSLGPKALIYESLDS